MQTFFPHPFFGWFFIVALVGILAMAAYEDVRKMIIPKWITVPTFVLGIVINIVRGGWMGAESMSVWIFSEPNTWLGMLDGFLFALVGFIATFAIFFLMWILQICRGGDVKLFAAVGAWIGIYYALWLLAVTVLVMFVLVVGRMLAILFSQGVRQASKSRKTAMTYALPLAISAALLLPYLFRFELQLAEPTSQKTVADQQDKPL